MNENKNNSMHLKKSEAKEIKILFKKYKKFLRSYYETANFEEPIAQLARRSGKVVWYEKATAGRFNYTHSDGTERYILLDPAYKLRFQYGRKEFSGYWLHEDHATPLPEQPTLGSDQVNICIDKTLNDIKKWKAEEYKARGGMWKSIGVGIALIILAYTLYAMLADDPVNPVQQTTYIVSNQTATILGGIIPWIKMKKKQ